MFRIFQKFHHKVKNVFPTLLLSATWTVTMCVLGKGTCNGMQLVVCAFFLLISLSSLFLFFSISSLLDSTHPISCCNETTPYTIYVWLYSLFFYIYITKHIPPSSCCTRFILPFSSVLYEVEEWIFIIIILRDACCVHMMGQGYHDK